MSGSSSSIGWFSSYVTKFGAGLVVLFALVLAAGVNAFAGLPGELSTAARADLLSGILTVVLSFVIVLTFVVAAYGRESFDALSILTERAQQMERGELDVDVETNRTDELGELYQSFAAMRDALRARIRQTEQQNQRLQRTAQQQAEVMRAIAEGDLSRRMKEDVDEPVLAELAGNFNDMMDDLEETMGRVQRFTEAVSMASTDLATQTEQAMEASKQVSDAAAEITQGSGQNPVVAQLEAAENGDASDLTGTATGGSLRPAAEGTGQETLESGMGIETGETVDAIDDLAEQMDRITEVTEFITRVATETNMLALNAGIEASKVEEGAEGFEVVAEEVKSLAEETRESAGEIEEITTEVRSDTNDAVSSILRQQAALLLVMNDQAEELAEAASELQEILAELRVSGGVDSGRGSSVELESTDSSDANGVPTND
jgi:methyl-accepting chemotaxis protein